MMTKRLKDHKYAQCHVNVYDNGDIYFWSYATMVIAIRQHPDTGVVQIACTGTYSATTRKQIGWFLREYAPQYSYHDMKSIAGNGYFDFH